MRLGTASVVRLEGSFRHSLKFLLWTKIVRLNGALGYVKKALTFVSLTPFNVEPHTAFQPRRPSPRSNRAAIFNAFNAVLFY